MRLLPGGLTEFVCNTRWSIGLRLRLIEELALGSQGSGTNAISREELEARILRAVGRRDGKAQEPAIEDYMRAEVREFWRGFPERQLLTDLFRRDALRRSGCRPCDRCRRPSGSEGLRIARGLWADVRGAGVLPFDARWESGAVSTVLAACYLPPFGVRSPALLHEYIERSPSSRAHFVALERIYEELDDGAEAIPPPLLKWWQEAAGGLQRRPAMKPVPPYRPPNPDDLVRDVQVQFTVELLQRLGVKPQGSPSGCRITAAALWLTEETVKRIWNKPVWGEPYGFLFRKHMKAIATRHGLLRTTAA